MDFLAILKHRLISTTGPLAGSARPFLQAPVGTGLATRQCATSQR